MLGAPLGGMGGLGAIPGAPLGGNPGTPRGGFPPGGAPGAVNGGTLTEIKESNEPSAAAAPGTEGAPAGLSPPNGGPDRGDAPAGLGMPDGAPIKGVGDIAGFTPTAPTPGEAGTVIFGPSTGTATGATPAFLTLVGKINIRLVPGSTFSADAPPPWA